jgi:hypothetical protein
MKIRRVILCSEGGSSNIDEWSNIPYMLHKYLLDKGIEVIEIDTCSSKNIKRLWKYTIGWIHKVINFRTSYDFYRSATNYILTTHKLNSVIDKYKEENTVLINLSISHSPTIKSVPVILISDWSYEHYIHQFLDRCPDWSEKKTILRDRMAMKRADLNILLFPVSARRLKRQVPDAQFGYISHVVNVHPEAPPPTYIADGLQKPSNEAKKKIRLLYVGRRKYKSGIIVLNKITGLISKNYDCFVDVIGISKNEVLEHVIHENIEFHGYLSKGNKTERDKFYKILNQADIMLNLTENWGPFSANLEAMYFYTMIITPKYEEFIEVFGAYPSFAEYIDNLDPNEITETIIRIMNDPIKLRKYKLKARDASDEHMWVNFIEKLVQKCSDL